MCEKNNAQQSVTKTPKETESREEVRMFEVSTDSLKKQNIPDTQTVGCQTIKPRKQRNECQRTVEDRQ